MISEKQRKKIESILPSGAKILKLEIVKTRHKESFSRENYKSIRATYQHQGRELSAVISSKVGRPSIKP